MMHIGIFLVAVSWHIIGIDRDILRGCANHSIKTHDAKTSNWISEQKANHLVDLTLSADAFCSFAIRHFRTTRRKFRFPGLHRWGRPAIFSFRPFFILAFVSSTASRFETNAGEP